MVYMNRLFIFGKSLLAYSEAIVSICDPVWRLANALKEFQAMEDELIHHLKNSLTEGMQNLEFQP